ncbi:MAG: hypothetical protein KDD22_05990 [Bdellovibrionales bacterium]|nr:hypothetical protein [Bdellovibrionales bacterium]
MKALLVACLLLTSLQAFGSNRESGGLRMAASVYFVFSSFGSGIDRQTQNLLEELIDMDQEKGWIADVTEEHWGREGEVTYCLQYETNNLEAVTGSRDIIRGVALPIIDDGKVFRQERTAVFLGLNCGDLENATRQDLTTYLD